MKMAVGGRGGLLGPIARNRRDGLQLDGCAANGRVAGIVDDPVDGCGVGGVLGESRNGEAKSEQQESNGKYECSGRALERESHEFLLSRLAREVKVVPRIAEARRQGET